MCPLAGPLAVIVFFGRFIPYIGGLVTTIILLLVTVASQGTTAALILLVLIAILNVIQGKFLAPVVYHKTVHIHPAIALIALPAGAALAGIVGLFAAIPVVAFVLAVTHAAVTVLGVEPERRAPDREPDRPDLARPARAVQLATARLAGACSPSPSRPPSRSRSS